MTGDVLKCRWCSFSVLKWRHGKNGKTISGWVSLRHHVEDEHPDEDETMRAQLDDICVVDDKEII